MSDTVELQDSWVRAEGYVFARLLAALQSKENVSAFRGFFPTPPDRPGWALYSGGLSVGGPERFWGSAACYSTIAINARFEAYNQSRDSAMQQAMAVVRFLADNSNLRNKSNVQELRISDMPGDPEPVEVGDGMLCWRVVLPMQLVYSTGTMWSE